MDNKQTCCLGKRCFATASCSHYQIGFLHVGFSYPSCYNQQLMSGKLAIIHQCLPKLGQLLSSYSHSAGHKTFYTVLEAKCIPNKLPHSKTKDTTACDRKRDRDVPSCNQEQQALMKPHAVTAFRLQIKLNHSAAEAEIRVNLWPLSQGISGWQTLRNIPTFEICRDRLQMLLQTH